MAAAIAVFVENRLQSGFDYSELEKAVFHCRISGLSSGVTGRSLSVTY